MVIAAEISVQQPRPISICVVVCMCVVHKIHKDLTSKQIEGNKCWKINQNYINTYTKPHMHTHTNIEILNEHTVEINSGIPKTQCKHKPNQK